MFDKFRNAFRSAVAGLLMGVTTSLALLTPMAPALALTVDQTRNFPARLSPDQQLAYYRLTINFNDQNIGAAQQFGALPAGAYIYAIDAYVTTAFNAATTNVITIGTTKASANEIVASGITAGTPGVYHLTAAAGLGLAVTSGASAVPLFAKYAQTGTAATTGQVTILIAYAANNDM
jgi:hypothetical protein